MASNCARKVVQRSTSSAKSLLFRSQSSNSAALLSTIRVSPRRRSFFFSSSSRLPVELGCGESLMPLHSVTASALLNSMLSCKVGQWGFLSEGFATPL